MTKRVGARIKQLRESRNLSLRQLAKILDVSAATIHHWEHGTSRCPESALLLLSAEFGVTLDSFYAPASANILSPTE